MPKTGPTGNFDTLYKDFKQIQSKRGLSGNDALGFRAAATIKGKALSRVLYVDDAKMRSRIGQPVDEHQDHAAARRKVRGMIERQYGPETAHRVFRNLPSDHGGPEHARLTFADLDHIHRELKQEQSFSAIHGMVKDLKDGRHLRAKGEVGQRVVYANSNRKFWLSSESLMRKSRRQQAGPQIWKAIAKEHGRAAADKVFRDVLGDTSADHRVSVTAGQVRRMKAALDKTRDVTHLASFSDIYKGAQGLRRGLSGDTHLQLTDDGKLRLPTGGSSQPLDERDAERAAVGPKLMAALKSEYGEARARQLVEQALPGRLDQGLTDVTLDDLDRIKKAINGQLDPLIDESARIEQMISKDPEDKANQDAFNGLLRENRALLGSAAFQNSPQLDDLSREYLNAALAFEAAERVLDGDQSARGEFAALVGADVEQMPSVDNREELRVWMSDKLRAHFLAPGAKLGVDPERNNLERLVSKLIQESAEKSPIFAMGTLKACFGRLLVMNDGARFKSTTAAITRGLLEQRHAGDDLGAGKIDSLHEQATMRAASSQGPGDDDEIGPRDRKQAALAELRNQAEQQTGAFAPNKVQERQDAIQEKDTEVRDHALDEATKILEHDAENLANQTIDKLVKASQDADVDRPMMSAQEFHDWVVDNVKAGAQNELTNEQFFKSPRRFCRALVPKPLRPGGQLQPKDEKLLWALALTHPAQAKALIHLALYPARAKTAEQENFNRQVVDKVYTGLMQGALPVLSARGNWFNGMGDNIRYNGREYKPVEELGSGSFGVAHLYEAVDADNNGDKPQIVVKQFKKDDFAAQQREIRSHLDVSSGQANPNDPLDPGRNHVLGLDGVLFHYDPKQPTTGKFMTVTPVAGGGDLGSVFDKVDSAARNGSISPEAAQLLKRRLIGQAVSGMAYMQGSRQMIHQDLKPENVFVTADGNAKVADFGMSTPGLTTRSTGGTRTYMAPEIAHNRLRTNQPRKELDAGLDVWSMGALMRRELFDSVYLPGLEQERIRGGRDGALNQAARFGDDPSNRVYEPGRPEMRRTRTRDRRGQEQEVPEKVRDVNMLGAQENLINAMMHPDPKQRPTLQAVAQHEYFSDPRLQDPSLQQLTEAIIKGSSADEIRSLGQQVDRAGSRGG